MFGRSKPVIFEDRYGRRRSRTHVPRWLILLLVGIAAGAAGVIYVQERHLPPRLSASESAQLRTSFQQTDNERSRLKNELDDVKKQLDTALAEKTKLTDELATSRQAIDRLRGDVAAIADALPPDPRGGAVEVRAARFTRKDTSLEYDVVLWRDRASSRPFTGVMQFVVAGDSSRGGETSVAPKPVPVSIGNHQVLRGSLPLPEGFMPRQSTIRVLDRPDGRIMGTRVIFVK